MYRSAVIKKNLWHLVERPDPDSMPQVQGEDKRENGGVEPRLQCEYENGVVAKIRLTCACGKELLLECVYDGNEEGNKEEVLEEKR